MSSKVALPTDSAVARTAVDNLHRELLRSLGDVLPRGTRAALVNYPNHHNVGDPALYVGTIRALRAIDVQVTYRCEVTTYDRASLARVLSRGTTVILINGGGNLGDQYPQQRLRETVLRDFASVQTIQLPQSVWFQDRARLDAFRTIVDAHRGLTLMLRDATSLAFARANFAAQAQLAPDLAFGIGPIDRPIAADRDVVWLRRQDREGTPAQGAHDGGLVAPFDWLTATADEAVVDRSGRWLLRANARLSRHVAQHRWLWPAVAATYDPLAARRLEFGLRELARGRVVVTDRLHGLILALLMGIPVVAVDNVNGKVRSFVDTWLGGVPTVHLADTHEAALGLARKLA